MYFFNKDGHTGHNRFRDYMIELYAAPRGGKIQEWPQYKFTDWPKYSLLAESLTRTSAPLAKSRVKDFWGGVHKQFVVIGPGYYFVKIRRNYSYNTILSSISVDRLHGKPTRTEGPDYGVPMLCQVPYDPPPLPMSYESGLGRRIALLWNTSESKLDKVGSIALYRKSRIAAFGYGTDDGSIQQLADSLKWRLNQWNEKQREEHREVMKRAHEELLRRSPDQKKAIEMYEKRGYR